MQKIVPTSKEHDVKIDAFLVSKTDTKGHITYCNQPFLQIVGAQESDLLGQPHRIIRHPDMPKIIFKYLWEKIARQEEIFAYIKNLSFDGGYYWVYANVTASTDSNRRIIGYYSIRRKANPKALDIIKPLYEKLLALEKTGGIDASSEYLTHYLHDKGVDYDAFSNALQRL